MSLRKFFSVSTIVLSISTLITTGQQESGDIALYEKSSIFKDQFNNNNNSWITDNAWIKGDFEYGFYTITCKNYHNQTGLTYKKIPVDQKKDYEIETSIKILRGAGALAFGISENFDHYRIELTNKENSLRILKDSPQSNKIEILFSYSLKSGINQDISNKITIRKISGSYFFLINDEQICRLNNIEPVGEQVGFSIGLNSEISVDYLNVDYLVPPTAPFIAGRDDTKITGRSASGPEITWISPSGMTTSLDSYTAKIRAGIKSASGLNNVLVYLNGVSKGEPDIKNIPNESGMFLIEKTLNFSPGENSVFIIASNTEGSTRSELRYFTNPIASPPVITWQIPSDQLSVVATARFTVEACIKSVTDLKSVKILVNGITLTEDNVFQPSAKDDCSYIWEKPVVLREGDNNVFIVATNEAGSTLSEERLIKLQPALTEKRIALVMGNSDYVNKASLKNPVNDANLMEATLKELGFDVIKRLNSGRDTMLNSIREFSRKLPEYNVALFYYAGHGIQVDGINYLIPTDAELQNKEDCKWEAIDVSTMTDEFKRHSANTNIVILDACRSNPYRSWARGEELGFKALAPINGTIISFATSEGATAGDGNSANGLFTEELVKQMVIPQPIESVFKNTRKQVIERSNGLQIPTEWSYLTGEFYFKK